MNGRRRPPQELLTELSLRSAQLRAKSEEAQKRVRDMRAAASKLIRETRRLLALDQPSQPETGRETE